MNIKKAQITDLQSITEIEAVCFPEAEAASKTDIRKRLEVYPDHYLLLQEDDHIIGFINGMVTDQKDLTDEMYEDASMHNEEGQWQMIFGLDVLPQYQKHGYGAQLIRAFIDEARMQKRKGLVLTCKERLLHYYASFGFVNEGISVSVHGNVTWYQMRLTFDS